MSNNFSRTEVSYRKKEVKNSKRAIIISTVSLICTVLSIIYMFYKDYTDSKEDIYVSVESMYFNKNFDTRLVPLKTFNSKHNREISGILPLDYQLILVNNGNKTVSIISYELLHIQNKKPVTYSYLNNGIYENDQSIKFPFSIEPGESKLLTIKLGVQVEKEVYNVLKKEMEQNKFYEIKKIQKILRTENIDLFGNKIIYLDGMSITNLNNDEEYKLHLTTSKGENFSRYFNIY